MNHYRKLCVLALALLGGGCAGASTLPTPLTNVPDQTGGLPLAAHAAALPTETASTRAYLYVADRGSHRLVVFNEVGSHVTGAIRSVAFTNGPYGVTTDHEGNVYASDPLDNEVLVYTPGLKRQLATIPVNSPLALTVDATDGLMVVGDEGWTVFRYHHGTTTPFGSIPADNAAIYGGIAMTDDGSLYEDVSPGLGGLAIICNTAIATPAGGCTWTHATSGYPGGLVLDGDHFIMGGMNKLCFFKKTTDVMFKTYGFPLVDGTIGFLAIRKNRLYVPLYTVWTKRHGFLAILDTRTGRVLQRIHAPLVDPFGVAIHDQ